MSESRVSRTSNPEKLAMVITKAFDPVPVEKYLFEGDTFEKRYDFKVQRMKTFINANAEILEIDDHKAIAIFLQPNIELEPLLNVSSRIKTFKESFKNLYEKYPDVHNPPGRDVWTLAYLAKDPTYAHEKGLISSLLKPMFQRIKDQGSVLELEAITPNARDIYIHYGFKQIGEDVVLGAGEVNSQGEPDVHGEGVRAYWMVYNL